MYLVDVCRDEVVRGQFFYLNLTLFNVVFFSNTTVVDVQHWICIRISDFFFNVFSYKKYSLSFMNRHRIELSFSLKCINVTCTTLIYC